MVLMTWTEQMSVGLPELDEDHKTLMGIINRLAENAGEGAESQVLRQCLYALMRYAQYHFGREESVLAACGYAELPDHRKEHDSFTSTIGKLAKSFDEMAENAVPKVNDELLEYLKNWLNHHILVIDMSYRPYVVDQAAAAAAAKDFKAAHIWWQS